jgi:hypothetical protein
MLSNLIATVGRVLNAKVGAALRDVVIAIEGFSQGFSDTQAENAEESLYGQIGVVSRPKPPVEAKNATATAPKGWAEVVCIRTEDGLLPVAGRDLRLNRWVPLAEGEVCVVGYGGGFISLRDASDKLGTQVILYAPALNSGSGQPSAAHMITMDPATANQSITILHAGGQAVMLTKNGEVIVKNAAGDAYVQVDAAGVTVNGNTKINGGVVMGDPATAQPLMLATELLAWIGQVNTVMAALNGAVGAVVPPITLPAAVPIAATKASAL